MSDYHTYDITTATHKAERFWQEMQALRHRVQLSQLQDTDIKREVRLLVEQLPGDAEENFGTYWDRWLTIFNFIGEAAPHVSPVERQRIMEQSFVHATYECAHPGNEHIDLFDSWTLFSHEEAHATEAVAQTSSPARVVSLEQFCLLLSLVPNGLAHTVFYRQHRQAMVAEVNRMFSLIHCKLDPSLLVDIGFLEAIKQVAAEDTKFYAVWRIKCYAAARKFIIQQVEAVKSTDNPEVET